MENHLPVRFKKGGKNYFNGLLRGKGFQKVKLHRRIVGGIHTGVKGG